MERALAVVKAVSREEKGSHSPGNPTSPQHCPADESVDPQTLRPHPWSLEVFGLGTEKQREQMRASVSTGIEHSLIITGNDCASGPNVVLAGCRRHQGGLDAKLDSVPVSRRHNLSDVEERAIIARDNLADKVGRKLSDYQIAKSEAALVARYRVGSGYRSDIRTSVEINRGSSQSTDVVARLTGSTRNAVKDRTKIVTSPLSTEAVLEAYSEGRVPRSTVARILRQVESLPAVTAALAKAAGSGAREKVISRAHAAVDRLLSAALAPKDRSRSDESTEPETNEDLTDSEPESADSSQAGDSTAADIGYGKTVRLRRGAPLLCRLPARVVQIELVPGGFRVLRRTEPAAQGAAVQSGEEPQTPDTDSVRAQLNAALASRAATVKAIAAALGVTSSAVTHFRKGVCGMRPERLRRLDDLLRGIRDGGAA